MSSIRTLVSLPWYHHADYQQMRRRCSDGRRLPDRFEDWLRQADAMRRDAQSRGTLVLKVHLDPATFEDWCLEHRLPMDGEARCRFAAETALLASTGAPNGFVHEPATMLSWRAGMAGRA